MSDERKIPFLKLTLICLGWFIGLMGFQWMAEMRLVDLVRPDYAVFWTKFSTDEIGQQAENGYLSDPFLNRHVAWDSEFYISIANHGYQDPEMRTVPVTAAQRVQGPGTIAVFTRQAVGEEVQLSYAFFAFYPWMMRLFSVPLSVFGLNEIATATLAGMVISFLGSLMGMIALYDIVRKEMGVDGAMRTVFYLLIFPSSMFMAQVYTEGLFVGLAFGSIALANRRKLLPAAILACCATLTRAVGLFLFVPLVGRWLIDEQWTDLDLEWREIYYNGIPWKTVGQLLMRFSPILTHLIWRMTPLGFGFHVAEQNFFGRGAFMFGTSMNNWLNAAQGMFQDNTQTTAYYLIEFAAIAIGLYACFAVRKRYPSLALYSFLAVFIALTSGGAQGMHRYVLAAPALFIWLGRLGRNPVFDRTYTIVSTLLMALLAILFTFDFWVG